MIEETPRRIFAPWGIEACIAKNFSPNMKSSALDIFSGLGGWKMGKVWTDQLRLPISLPPVLCSVEIEPRTATFSAKALNLNTVTAHHSVTSERKYWPKFPFIVIGDVDSCQILQQISCINTSVLVASPSCPPWSAASENTLGLATQLGQNMISTARYLHALRPLIFALENVASASSLGLD